MKYVSTVSSAAHKQSPCVYQTIILITSYHLHILQDQVQWKCPFRQVLLPTLIAQKGLIKGVEFDRLAANSETQPRIFHCQKHNRFPIGYPSVNLVNVSLMTGGTFGGSLNPNMIETGRHPNFLNLPNSQPRDCSSLVAESDDCNSDQFTTY